MVEDNRRPVSAKDLKTCVLSKNWRSAVFVSGNGSRWKLCVDDLRSLASDDYCFFIGVTGCVDNGKIARAPFGGQVFDRIIVRDGWYGKTNLVAEEGSNIVRTLESEREFLGR